MLLNFTSIADWNIVTYRKQRQLVIDNVYEKSRRVRHDYAKGNLVCVENTVIYQKLYYNKQGLYIITEVFKNGTVQFQRGAINE